MRRTVMGNVLRKSFCFFEHIVSKKLEGEFKNSRRRGGCEELKVASLGGGKAQLLALKQAGIMRNMVFGKLNILCSNSGFLQCPPLSFTCDPGVLYCSPSF